MNREQLISAIQADKDVKSLEIAGWGTVYVRDMTVAMVDMLNGARKAVGAEAVNMLAVSAAAIICDEQGNYLFDPTKAQDIAVLASAGWGKLQKVLTAGNAIVGDVSGN